MAKPVRRAREAREEVLEAARRYEEERPELRVEFLVAVDEALERLVRLAPHLGAPPGIDPAHGVRRVFMVPTRFRVLAFAHANRKPFYWRDREK